MSRAQISNPAPAGENAGSKKKYIIEYKWLKTAEYGWVKELFLYDIEAKTTVKADPYFVREKCIEIEYDFLIECMVGSK